MKDLRWWNTIGIEKTRNDGAFELLDVSLQNSLSVWLKANKQYFWLYNCISKNASENTAFCQNIQPLLSNYSINTINRISVTVEIIGKRLHNAVEKLNWVRWVLNRVTSVRWIFIYTFDDGSEKTRRFGSHLPRWLAYWPRNEKMRDLGLWRVWYQCNLGAVTLQDFRGFPRNENENSGCIHSKILAGKILPNNNMAKAS